MDDIASARSDTDSTNDVELLGLRLSRRASQGKDPIGCAFRHVRHWLFLVVCGSTKCEATRDRCVLSETHNVDRVYVDDL